MLASAIEDTKALRYPVLVSPKYDGIRATMQNGRLLSRTLKPIPNALIQELYKDLPEGIDGELIVGNPTSKTVFQDTTSVVMSHNKPIEPFVNFYVFDRFSPHYPFNSRIQIAVNELNSSGATGWWVVAQSLVRNESELFYYEQKVLDQGYEGVMIRDPEGPYKQGRSSVKQGWLLKLKRFVDAEAEIIGYYEEMENQNEATTNALGRTERSTKKEGMVGKGTLGGFKVVGINGTFKDVEFEVGSGLTADQRAKYYRLPKTLMGKILKYKYFPIGTKDKPRLPIFLGFRDKADM